MSYINYIKNIQNNIADIYLYGDVGGEISGTDVARNIQELNAGDIELINIHINSSGGSIIDGFSIIGAIFNSKTEIHTYNDGVAASMAGVILLTGKKVFMADYARLMLHEPTIQGENIENIKDEKRKNTLIQLKDSLATVIKNRTNKSKEDIDALLKAETWYNAKEARKQGFIDEIINYMKKPKIRSEMTADEVVASVVAFNNIQENFYKPKKKINKMENICKHLGLNDSSDEQSILNKIKAIEISKNEIQNQLDTSKEEIIEKEKEITDLTEKIEVFETEKVELNKNLVTQAITDAIKLGKFDEKDKDKLIEKFTDNLEGLNLVLNSIKEPVMRITDFLNKAQVDDKRKDWTIRDWEKKDQKGLDKIRNENPELYTEMYKLQYGEK